MKVLRIHLKAWTASYRFPPFAAVQPSLAVPPLSTLYGLISAVAGRLVFPDETSIGFVAPFEAKGCRDIEKIYGVLKTGKLSLAGNVIEREFIYNSEVFLYLDNLKLEQAFRSPRYPPLLGRSYDLAKVVSVITVDLKPVPNTKLSYTILPYLWEGVASPILALPVAFDEETPRRPLKVQSYHIIEDRGVDVKGDGLFLDEELDHGVYIHDNRSCKV